MKPMFRLLAIAAAMAIATSFTVDAKKKKDLVEAYPALAPYFSTPTADVMQPDEQGYLRRPWRFMGNLPEWIQRKYLSLYGL